MTDEQRSKAWQRCEEIRRELDLLAAKPSPAAPRTIGLLNELDGLEDALAADLLEQEGFSGCTAS